MIDPSRVPRWKVAFELFIDGTIPRVKRVEFEQVDGEWVRASDYDALLQQLTEARSAYEVARDRYLPMASQIETLQSALTEAQQARETAEAFVRKIAEMKMCADEPELCCLDSGPTCGAHGWIMIDDEITEARKLAASSRLTEPPT